MTKAEANEVARQVRKMTRDARSARELEGAEPDTGPSEQAALDWKENLLTILREMAPDAFERLCQRILREKGFTKVAVTGRAGDGGIDGQGVLRVNLLSFQVIFQAKRWKGSVGASVVRDFRGAMIGRADKGLIMTTARFTAEANREATRDGAPAIDLVDGEDFCDLLKEIGLGVRIKKVEEVSVAPADFADI
jgi:restriction system protein